MVARAATTRSLDVMADDARIEGQTSAGRQITGNSRTRDDSLHGVKGFNAREDRRHDRRTVSLEELRVLTEATQRGHERVGMTGPARALCYRLAVATGLRYAEISTITTGSFDWKAASVTVAACCTKNGHTANLPLQDDLVGDLASFVAELPPGSVIFPVPTGKGAKMLRYDLKAAGIPYRDESGLVFDFHSLRCQMATLADAAGVSPDDQLARVGRAVLGVLVDVHDQHPIGPC
jgi:integrase